MTYEQCPLQYNLVYVRKVPQPISPAMQTGTNIHAVIAEQFGQLPLFPPQLEPDLQAMLDVFLGSRFNVVPVGIEQAFEMPFQGGRVVGRIDSILPRSDGGVEVVDFKSGRPRTRTEMERSLQLPTYALAASALYGVAPTSVRYSYFFLRTGEELSFNLSDESIGALGERVEGILGRIAAGKFRPTPGCRCWACTQERRRKHARGAGVRT